MADGITFDKPAYAPGDKVTATVVDSKRKKSVPVNWTEIFATLSGTFSVVANGTLTATGYVWAQVSDDGVTAVFTTTA